MGRAPGSVWGVDFLSALIRAYYAVGNFLGKNLAWLVPVSILPGILLPQIFGPLNTIAPALFACMAFQGALSNRVSDVKDVFTRPSAIIVIFLVGQLCYPAIAFLGAHLLFGSDPTIMSGVVATFSAPIATTCMIWVGLYGGNASLGLTGTVLTSFLAPFTMPFMLQFLVGASVHIDIIPMMLQLLFMVVVPAIVAMAITEKTHGWGEEVLAPKLAPIAFFLMLFINMCNSSTLADIVRHFTLTHVFIALYMLGITAAFFLIGLALATLMRRDTKDKVAMSLALGMKNISSASTIATAYLPEGANLAILSGILYQATIAAIVGQHVGVPDTETEEYDEVEAEAKAEAEGA